MKSTGIVRRIDDLGRIVIPKEIRKTLRISEGDSIEINIGTNEDIVLKKHSTINDIWSFADQYANVLNKFISLPILIFDCDKIIIAKGKAKSEFLGLEVPKKLELALRKKVIIRVQSKHDKYIEISQSFPDWDYEYIVPIISNGDVIGGICCLSKNGLKEEDENIVKIAGSFIGKHLED